MVRREALAATGSAVPPHEAVHVWPAGFAMPMPCVLRTPLSIHPRFIILELLHYMPIFRTKVVLQLDVVVFWKRVDLMIF